MKTREEKMTFASKDIAVFPEFQLVRSADLDKPLCDPRETGPQNIQQQFGSILHKSVKGHGRNITVMSNEVAWIRMVS